MIRAILSVCVGDRVSDRDDPEPVSWWLKPDFDTNLSAFNVARKLMGDHDLPPIVRQLLDDQALCQHLAASAMPPPKHRP